ncbi:MAG: hypothetical protein ABSG68_00065 [Thermoguttaceae bacterium]|jgi:hypothetical protein
MNRTWIFTLAFAIPLMALAQSSPPPYQPAVPAPTTNVYGGGGWGGNTGASTAAGSAMQGMSQVISAAGQYNLSTSAAAINMTQAQRNEIENRQLWTNTYFDMRATNRKAREAERGPRSTPEQIARIQHDGMPKPLNTSQMDPVSGRLDWPAALQQDVFETERGVVDQLFATLARYGGLSYSDQLKVRQTVENMFSEMKAQIRQMPTSDYVASRTFLRGLAYTAYKGYL